MEKFYSFNLLVVTKYAMMPFQAFILFFLAYRINSENWLSNDNCLLFGRFLTNNDSLVNLDLFRDRPMIMSSLQHDDDLPESMLLVLRLDAGVHQYRAAVTAFHGFIEDTFTNISCIFVIDGSNSVSKEVLHKVCDTVQHQF